MVRRNWILRLFFGPRCNVMVSLSESFLCSFRLGNLQLDRITEVVNCHWPPFVKLVALLLHDASTDCNY